MKILSLLTLLALCAAASVATADVYDYDMDAPSTFSSQEEVTIGEGEMPAPIAENYGPVPSWGGGCCERVPSPTDHVWDNYCYEKHSGSCGSCGSGCCGRAFCGSGPFQKGCCGGKGCCKSSCGSRFHLPRLNLLGRCCQTSKCCTQKACTATKCCKQSCCHRLCLPKFGLFSRCCNSKCGKGCCKGQSVGSPVIESQVDEMPVPVIEDDMPPSPPMIDQAT